MKATLYFDGSNTRDFSKASGGFVLILESGEKLEGQKEVNPESLPPGARLSNNVGEYTGLLVGLRRALLEGVTEIEILGDSQLVLRQLTGAYKVKAEHLKVFHAAAVSLLGKFDNWSVAWVSGWENPADDVSRTGDGEGIRRTKKTKTGIRSL